MHAAILYPCSHLNSPLQQLVNIFCHLSSQVAHTQSSKIYKHCNSSLIPTHLSQYTHSLFSPLSPPYSLQYYYNQYKFLYLSCYIMLHLSSLKGILQSKSLYLTTSLSFTDSCSKPFLLLNEDFIKEPIHEMKIHTLLIQE